MNIREKVARAVVAKQMEDSHVTGFSLGEAIAAIDAFLAAAAEKGWHMRPDQVTREMMIVGIRRSPAPQQVYEDMHNAAPKFEVGE